MAETKSITEKLVDLTSAWKEAKNFSDQSKILTAVGEIGSEAWRECESENDLNNHVAALGDKKLKSSFLNGVARSINTPANKEVFIASILRPYVDKTIREISQLKF